MFAWGWVGAGLSIAFRFERYFSDERLVSSPSLMFDLSRMSLLKSLCEIFCSCDFPESQRKLGPFALSIGGKHTGWRISLSL